MSARDDRDEPDALFDDEDDRVLREVDTGEVRDGRGEGQSRKRSMFDLGDDDDDANVEVKKEAEEGSSPAKLTAAQRARAERNRLRALTLKQARLMSRAPREAEGSHKVVVDTLTGDRKDVAKEKKVVDSGAGFFIEEDPDEEGESQPGPELSTLPAPILEPDRPACQECGREVADSFLLRTFDLPVCDGCRDTEPDGRHELITKTDAKNTFLLKDCDLDRSDERMSREDGPAEEASRKPLKFVLRKNPHNARWGDMKLYLRSQVEELALSVWGTEEALERAHEERNCKKERAKQKKFDKKMKELRMRVRGSLFKRELASESAGHQHEFGEEGYDEEEDEYHKTCATCGFVQRYEKM